MDLHQATLAGMIGLAAGIIGGLAGVGGSMVMLPGLAIVFGFAGDPRHSLQHVYQAAAMTVNVLVALPATVAHARAGTVRRELVIGIVPAMALAIVAGVLVSNLVPGDRLKQLLAAFIAAYCLVNVYRVARPRSPHDPEPAPPRRATLALTGSLAGFVGGVLGLGGGVVTVPLLQIAAGVRLRHAIGASSAAMIVTAGIGAALKLVTLGEHGHAAGEALWLTLAMGPAAVGGALIGSALTHALPVRWVRLAVSVLLLAAAARMVAAT